MELIRKMHVLSISSFVRTLKNIISTNAGIRILKYKIDTIKQNKNPKGSSFALLDLTYIQSITYVCSDLAADKIVIKIRSKRRNIIRIYLLILVSTYGSYIHRFETLKLSIVNYVVIY